MSKNWRKVILGCLWMVCSMPAWAQTATMSPYTQFGLGLIERQGNAMSRGMGGTGYALRDPYSINHLNPASYSAVDSLTFIFDGGLSLQNTNLEENSLRKNARTASFDYVTMTFRATKWCGISLGMLPYSSIGYDYTVVGVDSSVSENSELVEYTGTGGLHQVYLGASFRPIRSLSIGAQISYLWGDVSHTISQTFPYNTTAFGEVKSYVTDIRSIKLDFGLQYTHRINSRNSVTLGAVYSPKMRLHNTSSLTTTTGSSSSDYSVVTTDFDYTYDIPSGWGVGVAYNYGNKLIVAADYSRQDWQKARYQSETDYYCNTQRISAGVEFQPNLYAKNYLKNIKYRIGGYYAQPNVKVNGERALDEYGASIGLGFPILRSRSMVNLTGQYARLRAKNSALLSEHILRVCVGITFNERWFFKRQVE